MSGRRPTLAELNYEADPPACGNCSRHFYRRGPALKNRKPVQVMVCKLTMEDVRARGICDRWRGAGGVELDP